MTPCFPPHNVRHCCAPLCRTSQCIHHDLRLQAFVDGDGPGDAILQPLSAVHRVVRLQIKLLFITADAIARPRRWTVPGRSITVVDEANELFVGQCAVVGLLLSLSLLLRCPPLLLRAGAGVAAAAGVVPYTPALRSIPRIPLASPPPPLSQLHAPCAASPPRPFLGATL